MVRVRLGWSEIHVATTVGMQRHISDIRSGYDDVKGAELGEGWQYHIVGAIGEQAVAKRLGEYWTGNFGDLSATDVGNVEVRTAQGKNHRLIVHDPPKDDPQDIFVLAIVTDDLLPRVLIPGWLFGAQATDKGSWEDPTGQDRYAYFTSQDDLRPLSELEKNLNQH